LTASPKAGLPRNTSTSAAHWRRQACGGAGLYELRRIAFGRYNPTLVFRVHFLQC
jgi:hypothetical protein